MSSVSMVINYLRHPPGAMKGRSDDEPDHKTYLHRNGRTSRVSISFVSDKKSYQGLNKIATHYGIKLVKLDTEDWDDAEEKVQDVIKKNRGQASWNFLLVNEYSIATLSQY
ncbi:uncharacterized protein F5Z01DRAFT_636920 [Emericellopsis atlantica]|uniref:Uncharacterized protein n=1 Tax=Emericellopsis atlantica TaxID=2614577 RepID=A0A9P8CP29_9HYPO|nr:uncharacterized protein F5Z01DRAFT_636920 [Emericellopsis atlantica]KAG9253695.1 hypothetical protein F5Z01DRAFT_636920 [Emericellopsis atlantica]